MTQPCNLDTLSRSEDWNRAILGCLRVPYILPMLYVTGAIIMAAPDMDHGDMKSQAKAVIVLITTPALPVSKTYVLLPVQSKMLVIIPLIHEAG